jgi:hypothetical protein
MQQTGSFAGIKTKRCVIDLGPPRTAKDLVHNATKLAAAVLLAVFHGTVATVSAGDLDDVKQRLLAARKHNEMDRIYKSIERKLGGNRPKIVEFLRASGFSCSVGSVPTAGKCVFAYCGDRRFFRRELMTITVGMVGRDVTTSVVHQPAECPPTNALLKEKQEYLLSGGDTRK